MKIDRARLLRVKCDDLADMLIDPAFLRFSHGGIPAEAKLTACVHDDESGELLMRFEHQSFDIVSPGQEYPSEEVNFKFLSISKGYSVKEKAMRQALIDQSVRDKKVVYRCSQPDERALGELKRLEKTFGSRSKSLSQLKHHSRAAKFVKRCQLDIKKAIKRIEQNED